MRLAAINDMLKLRYKRTRFIIAMYFLNQDGLTEKKKNNFISSCERIISRLRSTRLFEYKGLDVLDDAVSEIFGYSTNLSSAVKVYELSKSRFKLWLFLQGYYVRFITKYWLKDGFLYGLNLYDAKPTTKTVKKKDYDVAFICNTASFINSYTDLMKHYKKRKKRVLLIIPKSGKHWKTSLNDGSFTNVDIVYIEDFYTKDLERKLYIVQMDFLKRFKEKRKHLKACFTIGKTNLFRYFSIPLKRYFSKFLPEIIICHDLAGKIFDTYNIKTLIGGKPKTYVESAFLHAAKNKGIKTASIIHVFHNTMIDLHYDLGQVDLVDYVFVNSQFDKELYLKRTSLQSKTKVLCLGNPQFQKIRENKLPFKDYKKQLGLKKDYVLYTSSPLTLSRHCEAVLDVCNELGIPLVVKMHPREDERRFDFLKKKGAIIVDNAEVELYPLMAESRMVISWGSMTVLESIMIGTPAIYFEPTAGIAVGHYFAFEQFSQMVPVIRSKQDLKRIVRRFYPQPKKDSLKEYKKFFNNYKTESGQNAIEEMAKIIG